MVTVLQMVLMMLLYMAMGYLVVKGKKGETAHARTVSGILIYICGPAMILNAFLSMTYSPQHLRRLGVFFLASLLIQALFSAGLYALFRKKHEDSRFRVLTIASVMGNAGFLGLPLISALFPGDPIVAGYSSMYLLAMNLLAFTLGEYMLTRNAHYISARAAVLNPTTLTILAALPLYILGARLPERAAEGVALLGKMTTPLCMIVLGMRLAAVDMKKLFARPFAYGVCGLKLIVFPLFAYGCACLTPWLDPVSRASILVLSAVPSAAVILSLAELHGCEQELSANVVLLTTLLSVITLPLIMLIL